MIYNILEAPEGVFSRVKATKKWNNDFYYPLNTKNI